MILQESLVAMFGWCRGSSLILVYLRDVLPEARGKRPRPPDIKSSVLHRHTANGVLLLCLSSGSTTLSSDGCGSRRSGQVHLSADHLYDGI